MKKRARDLGLPFEGTPGEYNAITDVEGVEVGFSTIITGESTEDTTEDSDFARTGVTAILPRGKKRSAVFAGRYDHNGNGEMTGTHWID
ncbi:MAG: P1 family peptidase, partial [Clostridia bacterium]